MSRVPGAAGSPRIPGTVPAGGGGVINWIDILLGTGAPDFNDGPWVSTVDQGGGIHLITIDKTLQLRGPVVAPSWRVGLEDNWHEDGTKQLLMQLRHFADPTNTISYVSGMCLIDNGGNPAGGTALGPAWFLGGAGWEYGYMTRATISRASVVADEDDTNVGTVVVPPSYQTGGGIAIAGTTATEVYSNKNSSSGVGANSDILCMVGNWNSDGGGGNQSAPVGFRYAIVDKPVVAA